MSFQRAVQLVSVKNQGLQTKQTFYSGNYQITTPGWLLMDPVFINHNDYTLMGILTSGQDQKIWLERQTVISRYFNNSNVPLVMRVVYGIVKCDVPTSSYISFDQLLEDGAPAYSVLGAGDPLTSNAAQRYLSWVDTYTCILEPGKMKMVSVSEYKNRMVTGDYEGSTAFHNVKGDRFALVYFDGIPISDEIVSSNVSTGPISVQWTQSVKVTWRNVEENDNVSTVQTAFPFIGTFGDVVQPIVDSDAPKLA